MAQSVVILVFLLAVLGGVSGATFSYKDCVRVEAEIKLRIKYQDLNNKTVISEPIDETDDSVAHVGKCYSPASESLPHVGKSTGYPDKSVIRGVWFYFNNSADVVSMMMRVEYDSYLLPNSSQTQETLVVADSKWMEVSNINNSYLCTTPMSMPMGDKVVAFVNKIQAQAYNMKSGEFSNSTDECEPLPTTTPTKPTTTKSTTTSTSPVTPTTAKSTTTKPTTASTSTVTSTTTKSTSTNATTISTTTVTPTTNVTDTTMTSSTTTTTPTISVTRGTPTTITATTTTVASTTGTTTTTGTTNTTKLFSYQECVRVEADIKLRIKYQDLNNKTQTSGPIDITDNTVAAEGQCASAATVKDPYPYVGKPTGYPDTSVIRGIWFFFKNSSDVVSMRIKVEYDPSLLPNSEEKLAMIVIHSEWMAVSHINNSYLCTTPMSMSMGDKVVTSVNTIQAQAYNMKSGVFSNSTDGCNAFSTTTPTTPTTTTPATTKPTPTTPTTTKSNTTSASTATTPTTTVNGTVTTQTTTSTTSGTGAVSGVNKILLITLGSGFLLKMW